MIASASVRRSYLTTVMIAVTAILAWTPRSDGRDGSSATKRQITVADATEMTRLVPSSDGRVVQFSPDGRRFVLLLRRGNSKKSVNEFSIFLFRTSDVFKAPRPELLVRMASSSNRDAIHDLKWLADNDTIVFVGENPGQASQVFALRIVDRFLKKLTNHPTSVTRFDMTDDGQSFVYEADRRAPNARDSRLKREALVIRGQGLDDLLTGKYAVDEGPQVFLERFKRPPLSVPSLGEDYRVESSQISPDGRYALVRAEVRNVPPEWRGYNSLQAYFSSVAVPGSIISLSPHIYFLFDSVAKTLAPLVKAPGGRAVRWKQDGSSVFLETQLPLDAPNPAEREAREQQSFLIEIALPRLKTRELSDGQWPKEKSTDGDTPVTVTLEEDINTPPKLYTSDPKTNRKKLLLDLNPRFQDLRFGKVEVVEWKVEGVPVIGGLYLPPDYTTGKRYPLVIQTHGFDPNKFSMDGTPEWGSAYAARPLAAKGVLVLQAWAFKDSHDHDHYNDDRRLGATVAQAGRNINVGAYERAIDLLDDQGLIDRNRVGIVGFSRTVSTVAYTLTHSRYSFAAASLVDGIDAGYFQEIAYPNIAWDFHSIYAGAAPFGGGLETWLKECPSFALGNVNAPVRLFALREAGILTQWEWYAALALQEKPVEYAFLPDEGDGENHLLVKPWERKIAQQGLTDWFVFWLKGEEDPDPSKKEQYARWRKLRELSSARPRPHVGPDLN
jgi:dipeptidyl aminopeptidase/acylaminoacyl peptidase